MSTALTARIESLPALASLPRLSSSLAYYVAGDTLYGDHLHPVHDSPGPGDIAEARRLLPQAAHLCRPPTFGLIVAWCKKLVPHLPRAPVSEAELMRAVEGIVLACGDLPYAVWTAETAGEALRTLEWWPPPAKLLAILAPHGERYRRLRDRLARIIEQADRASEPAAQPVQPTPEAQAYVAALVKAFVAERSFSRPGEGAAVAPVKPMHLSDGALLALYERLASEGGAFARGAATMAALLRRRISL
jgi:hypothetical protein